MAIKVQKLKERTSPFAGISFVNETLNKPGLIGLIDRELGLRIRLSGYQYSEIIRNLAIFLSLGEIV